VSIDARLLIITGDGSDPGLDAITQTLGYLGTPFDVLNASSGPTLTADYLAAGDAGRYYGIILDTGDLAVGSSSAFTDDEWMVLASYEARFGVRRAVVYAHPTAAYGLQLTGGFDVKASPVVLHCTSAGSNVFVGANCTVPIAVTDGFAYTSQPTDAFTLPLLVDTGGSVYAATRSYSDGRETLVLTFAQSPTAMHTLGLAYGVVSWVTRGLFLGERHVYMSPQIDDFYLASAIYAAAGGGTYRITAADLQTFTNWQNSRRAGPLTAQFRASFAFNAYGAKPAGQDALSDKARELGPTYEWINHTWDHKEMTAMAYAEAFEEFSKNNQFGLGSGLSRYETENLVTPGITGLDNSEVMHAAYDVGIRQLVSDTSVAGQNNPSPNAGYLNAQVPGILVIPRHPTDLYFNVSQPSEWMIEYGALHMGTFTYDQVIAASSDTLVRYLLRGENDPWMFHQANIRDLGGQSMLSTLLDATLDKYAGRATFPVLSPTMEELADRVRARMAFDASGASATITPGANLTVRVTNAATVPVTGLCTPGAETYAGQSISSLALAAGQSITLSLADCNSGTLGTGGNSGAGGSIGSGAGGSIGGLAGSPPNGWADGGPTGAGGNTGALTTDAGPGHPDTGCSCLLSGHPAQIGAGVTMIVVAIIRRRSATRAAANRATRT
jgi:peptidoglycan/xylan/chitin deacetylase (PgdA/CDA1 family)